MEVVDSPLNLAHQQNRQADRLLLAGKYEEAILCHGKAADLLEEAMKLTPCEQAHLSLELQRESHIKQQRLIEERWKRARREQAKPQPLQSTSLAVDKPLPGQPQAPPSEREYDTWMYLLKHKTPPGEEACAGSKAQKDERTRLEEQETALGELRRLVDELMQQNEHLVQENRRLRDENARLRRGEPYGDAHFVERSELWAEERSCNKDIPIPHLPPLEMPAHDISMELPEDIQKELQELLDRDKL